MTYKLMGGNVSPFVRKVRVFLAEKGIEYDYEQVSPFSPPEGWREISPLGKIPALLDGENVINDSTCICQYIERKNPVPVLIPADDEAYIRALWLEEFIDAGFVPVAGGKVFFPLVVGPMLAKEPPSEEVRADVRKIVAEEFPIFWNYLEKEIAGKEFFVGDALTIADIAVVSIHVNLKHAGIAVDAARWPRLASYVSLMFERPSFKAVIDEETPTWTAKAA